MQLLDSALQTPGIRPNAVPSREAKSTDAEVVLRQTHSGSRLHRTHDATVAGEPILAGPLPRAQGEGSATDNDRVGDRQPLPSGSIGGP